MVSFSTYIFSVISFIIVYAFGYVLYNTVYPIKRPYESFFLKLVLGILGIVLVYSIVRTRGNTIFLGLLLFLLLYLFTHRKRTPIQWDAIEYKQLTIAIAVLSLFFILIAFFIFGPSFYNKFLYHDFSFYAAIAHSLKAVGSENLHISLTENIYDRSFYHYFELWLAAFFSLLYKTPTLTSLIQITQPLLLTIMSVGAYTVCNTYIPNKRLPRIICVISVFAVPFLAEVLNSVFNTTLFVNFSMLNQFWLKYTIIVICIIWWFLYVRDRQMLHIPLLVLTFVYSTTLFVITASVVLHYTFFVKKSKQSILHYGILLFPFLFYIVYYGVWNSSGAEAPQSVLSKTIENFTNFTYTDAKKLMGDVLLFAIRHYSLYILFLIPVGVYIIKHTNILYTSSFIFFIILSISAFAIIPILLFYHDAIQLHSNIYQSFIYIGIIVSFIVLYTLHAPLFYVLSMSITIVFASLFYDKYVSHNDYSKHEPTIEVFKKISAQPFTSCYIQNAEVYEWFIARNIDLVIPFTHLRMFTDSYYPVCLSVIDIPEAKTEKEKESIFSDRCVKNSQFYVYAQERNDIHPDTLKLAYLREHAIDYLFLAKGNSFYKLLPQLPVKHHYTLEGEPFDIIQFAW